MRLEFSPPTASARKLPWLHGDNGRHGPHPSSGNDKRPEPRSPSDFVNHTIQDVVPSASTKRYEPLHGPYPVADSSLNGPASNFGSESIIKETVKPEPVKRELGMPPKEENTNKVPKQRQDRLWEFLIRLLSNPETCPSLIQWVDREKGIFKYAKPKEVARMWGQRKENGSEVNYENFTRVMRYNYNGGFLEPVKDQRLVYKFGENAKGWQPSDPNSTSQGLSPSH